MTSFSLDPAAVDRLRAGTGAPAPSVPDAAPEPSASEPIAGWFEGDTVSARAKSFARRVLAPAERRMQHEVARAVERHDTELQAQVDQLRAELIRTRTAHAAELAALHEQLRGRR